MKTIPVRSPQMEEEEKENSSLSVGVRIDERGPLVRIIVVGSTLTVRMKGLRHEFLRGHVQCMYRSTSLPSGGSIVTQASLLENLHRLDTMLVEEVAKKSRDTISPRCRRTGLLVEEVRDVGGQINDIIFGLGTRFGERRTSRVWGAWAGVAARGADSDGKSLLRQER